jgi:hypothetical protein
MAHTLARVQEARAGRERQNLDAKWRKTWRLARGQGQAMEGMPFVRDRRRLTHGHSAGYLKDSRSFA